MKDRLRKRKRREAAPAATAGPMSGRKDTLIVVSQRDFDRYTRLMERLCRSPFDATTSEVANVIADIAGRHRSMAGGLSWDHMPFAYAELP